MISAIVNLIKPNRNSQKTSEPVTVEVQPRNPRPLGKIDKALLECGAIQYDDCYALFMEDVTIIIVDAANMVAGIWAQPEWTNDVFAFNADNPNEYRWFATGAELVAELA